MRAFVVDALLGIPHELHAELHQIRWLLQPGPLSAGHALFRQVVDEAAQMRAVRVRRERAQRALERDHAVSHCRWAHPRLQALDVGQEVSGRASVLRCCGGIEMVLALQPKEPIAISLGDRFASPWGPTSCDADVGQEIIISNGLSPERLVDVRPCFETN